jgi:anaerobic selenocysteine-containing dehydrogenase
MTDQWHKTACILCSVNCGIEVKLDGRHITRVRGNREHVASHGYACEKAQRIDYYQNGKDRLTSPLRRRADGTFEEIDWDTAIREVAERLVRVRDTHGGASIFYYGGGGQGNHLAGAYSLATRRALGSMYSSNALAQEKTGEFWVDGQLYNSRPSPDFEHAEVAMFVGKNPWQSHGFQTRIDRDRSENKRNRRTGGLSSSRAARHRRVLPECDSRRSGPGRSHQS